MAVIAATLALASCTQPAADPPLRTAPTHVDTIDVPASLGAADLSTAADLPEPRTEVAGAAFDGRIVVLGGLRADGSTSDRVDAWDPTTDRWEPLPDLPVPLHHTAVVAHRGRLWVLGGYADEQGTWVPQAATYSLGPGESDWTEGLSLPEARGALAAVSTGDAVWVAGGVGPDGLSGDTFVLRRDSDGWRSGPGLREPREHLGMAVAGDRVYVIAGRVGGLATNLDAVEVLDLRSGTLADGPPLIDARGGTAAATIAASPCTAGGEEPSGTIATVECLGPSGWEQVATLAVPRHGLAVVALDGRLHVIGGGPEPGLTVSGTHEVLSFPDAAER